MPPIGGTASIFNILTDWSYLPLPLVQTVRDSSHRLPDFELLEKKLSSHFEILLKRKTYLKQGRWTKLVRVSFDITPEGLWFRDPENRPVRSYPVTAWSVPGVLALSRVAAASFGTVRMGSNHDAIERIEPDPYCSKGKVGKVVKVCTIEFIKQNIVLDSPSIPQEAYCWSQYDRGLNVSPTLKWRYG